MCAAGGGGDGRGRPGLGIYLQLIRFSMGTNCGHTWYSCCNERMHLVSNVLMFHFIDDGLVLREAHETQDALLAPTFTWRGVFELGI